MSRVAVNPPPVTLSIDSTANGGVSGEGDNIKTDVEGVTGGSGADTIKGSGNNDILNGGLGDDDMTGGNGTDIMYGDGGNDTFHSKDTSWNDAIFGGDGASDRLDVGERDAGDTFSGVEIY